MDVGVLLGYALAAVTLLIVAAMAVVAGWGALQWLRDVFRGRHA